MPIPTDYIVPAYLVSGAVTALSIVKVGIWLKTSVNGKGSSSQSVADAEFRGKQSQATEQHTRLLGLILDEQQNIRQVLVSHTGLLEQLVEKLK